MAFANQLISVFPSCIATKFYFWRFYMKHMAVLIFSVILAIFSVCSQANAVPIYYTVSGTLYDGTNSYVVSGSAVIESELKFHVSAGGYSAGDSVPTDFVRGTGYPSQFDYYINTYNFQIGDLYSIYGTDGQLYFEAPVSLPGVSDRMWFLDNPQGDWDFWYGEHFYFFDDMGNVDDNSWESLTMLPQQIRFSSPNTFSSTSAPQIYGNIWLTQTAAPVPEPGTAFLLIAGLGVVVKLRKKHSSRTS